MEDLRGVCPGSEHQPPADIQLAMLRTIPGLEQVRITRYGYAVEYDAIEPTELTPWFASKRVDGLFLPVKKRNVRL
ncbi:MAG: FAD-dependent oxidoreductase [Thermomicrobiales bacterium]